MGTIRLIYSTSSRMENSAQTQATPGTSFFAVKNITKTFGSLKALDDLTFDIRRDEIFGIVGPNGAGKSTLLNVCTGALKPNFGTICFEEKAIEGLPPHRMCHLGIARTFQVPRVFESLSIRENIKTAVLFGRAGGISAAAVDEAVNEILDMTDIVERRDVRAGQADLLTRKMTMLGAVLATQPRIIFMDEPLAGLNSEEIDIFIDLIFRIHNEQDVPFVIVEHKIKALTKLSDRLMVVHFGHSICVDTPEAVVRDPQVVEVYLGTAFDA